MDALAAPHANDDAAAAVGDDALQKLDFELDADISLWIVSAEKA